MSPINNLFVDFFIEPRLEFRDGCLKSWLLEYSGTGVFICSVLEIRVHVSFVVGVCESGVCLCLECRYLWGLWVRCRYAMMCEYLSYLQIMIGRIFGVTRRLWSTNIWTLGNLSI